MIRFDCDYLEGAHPKILKRLVETNYIQQAGYSKDDYTKSAIEKIKKSLNNDNVDIHILAGGTQTNMIAISSALRSYQGVICADTGHINVHETGAIESLGNKIITIENEFGKINANQIEKIVKEHYQEDAPEHMVMPKLVFITLPTECGTNYTKCEIEEIYNVCKKYDMYLYIDGARLGYGLCAKDTDIVFEDLPNICDFFYIGGTKCGAMFGEALVIVNDKLKKDFRYYIKQKGALLAKGRLLGIQFDTLFTNDLYFCICRQAVELSLKLKNAFIEKGYKLAYNSFTNQQFIIMSKERYNKLSDKFVFFKWKNIDDESLIVRICTSWATTQENVDELICNL